MDPEDVYWINVAGKIILKSVVRKWNVRLCTGLIWLSTGVCCERSSELRVTQRAGNIWIEYQPCLCRVESISRNADNIPLHYAVGSWPIIRLKLMVIVVGWGQWTDRTSGARVLITYITRVLTENVSNSGVKRYILPVYSDAVFQHRG
jgi:hypothetical protein